MACFKLTSQTTVICPISSAPVQRAVRRFVRDCKMTLASSDLPGGHIELCRTAMEPEKFEILFPSPSFMQIQASDDLGFIYALLYISAHFLGIQPFWFWCGQCFEKRPCAEIPIQRYTAPGHRVRLRGWFLNDEVLLMGWKPNGDDTLAWEMALEALLRCGGNIVIPGTGENARRFSPLAREMGLWITHHHAEPLGARMFKSAYPDLPASYLAHSNLFWNLWREAVVEQKDEKVLWALGFRGQGDVPFWENDPQYATDTARGALIGEIIAKQKALVKEYVKEPLFCVNLYGEVLELYRKGCLQLPEDVMPVWADNGYGKMVTRRQGNHNPRLPSLPDSDGKEHGMYYHLSFYDLQAANHVTMFPNSMEFVERELSQAYAQGIRALWMLNVSNVKPHLYPIDFLRNQWGNRPFSAQQHLENFLDQYYFRPNAKDISPACRRGLAGAYHAYAEACIPYGCQEDEHAGEQFTNYTTRVLACHIMQGCGEIAADSLRWAAPYSTVQEQLDWYANLCRTAQPKWTELESQLVKLAEILPESGRAFLNDTLLLSVKIHTACTRGALLFCEAAQLGLQKEYWKAFVKSGDAARQYRAADLAMRSAEKGIWKGFYENECLTDIKYTAYILETLMQHYRLLGDGPHFYGWQRKVLYSKEEQDVVLITNLENHLTSQALYEMYKRKSPLPEHSERE